jgi:hypothetical protein
MALPGFSAETSMYTTSVHYRLMDASVQIDGVMLQQVSSQLNLVGSCGPCYTHTNGQCSRDCGRCVAHNACVYWTEPCNPLVCPPPNCTARKDHCTEAGGNIVDCHPLVGGCASCPDPTCCFVCV